MHQRSAGILVFLKPNLVYFSSVWIILFPSG